MKCLYVLYDAECELCRRLRGWLAQKAAFVPLNFLPLQSAGTVFPGIERLHPGERLLVISDAGNVWRGESAWIMVLWALKETREWSMRLATPALRPFAKVACEAISQRRHAISNWLKRDSVDELRWKLELEEKRAMRRRVCERPADG